MELINAVLQGTAPVEAKAFYQGYLNQMPIEGSYHLQASDNSGANSDSRFQTGGWAGEYRWTNPSEALGAGEVRGIFNSMDYMLFHNLYKLLFPASGVFVPTTNCYCQPAIAETPGGSSGQIEATNALNYKLSMLETCTPNVFGTTTGIGNVFDIYPKFMNYADMGIFTSDFMTLNTTVSSTGTINVYNRFILCNSKVLMLQASGRVNVNKGELVINSAANLNASGEIRIKSGTQLKINNLGKLILNASSKLIIEDGGKLIIEAGGFLEYYNGAQIITQGENSEIIMRGNVKVMNAGTFKVDHAASTASGRLILDGGMFNAEQAGTTIDLKGKSITDEFIVIKPTRQLWITDTEISQFIIDKCRMELPTGSKIWVQQPFSSTDVDYYCATHCLGFELTEKSDFKNCNFKDVHINAQLATENKGQLGLMNCNFTRNAALTSFLPEYVLVNGMGYTIYNCTFTNTRLNGISSFNLTYPSTVTASTFTQNTSQGRGIKDNSAVELIVKGCTFSYLKYGIDKYSGKLSLKCNTFQHNQSLNISVYNGCLLNMSTNDFAGYNYLYKTAENKNAFFSDAIVNIANGYNFIDDNCTYVFQGTLTHFCLSGFPCYLVATKNQWNTGNTVPAANKFSLTIGSGAAYPVNFGTVALKPMCGFYDAPDPGNPNNPNGKSLTASDGMPMIQTSFNDSIRLDSAVVSAMRSMELNDSLGNDLDAVEIFNDVFSSQLSKTDTVAAYWLEFSLHHMKTALENAFSNAKISRENNASEFEEHVAMYANALMYMTDTIIDESNYLPQFYHEMNKAHLYRLIGHPGIGLNILTGLENCGLDSAEQQHLNYWKTQFSTDLVFEEIGVEALDTTIVIDTSQYNLPLPLVLNEYYFGAKIKSLFDIAYPNCAYYTPGKIGKEEVNPEFALYPNPADETVNVVLNHTMLAGTSSTLVFQAADGKIVHELSCSETQNTRKTIHVSNWKPGVYVYRYTLANGKMYMGKLVVR